MAIKMAQQLTNHTLYNAYICQSRIIVCLTFYFSNQLIAFGFYGILFKSVCLISIKFKFEITFAKNNCAYFQQKII